MPVQPSAAIRDSSGNTAASVLPPAVGREQQRVLAAQERLDRRLAAAAAGAASPRVLTTWCRSDRVQQVERRSQVAGRCRPRDVACGVAFDVGQLRRPHGQRVVPPRVEVVELVDPVEDVADQLLQEHPRRDADLAAEAAGDRSASCAR